MRKVFKKILLSVFPEREIKFMGVKNYFKYAFFQRIFRVNSQVPWPVHWTSFVCMHNNIKYLNENSFLGYSPGSYVQAINGIVIGTNVVIGPRVSLISSNHEINDFTMHTEGKPIFLGDNCWLGANVVILPGVELAEHTIVAAGSVVTKSFNCGNCILGGVPAKIIREIGKYDGAHYYPS